jgi:uncharacterized membrane protein YjgN (DUF898 family)
MSEIIEMGLMTAWFKIRTRDWILENNSEHFNAVKRSQPTGYLAVH